MSDDLRLNQYGFVWKDVLVERTASHDKPKWRVLRVYGLNGDCVEILMRPRSTKVKVFPRPKVKS